MFFGIGSVYGGSSIDTSPVNHCSSCGHQWPKENNKWISDEDIVADWIDYMYYQHIGKHTFLNKFYKEVYKEISDLDVYAESVWKLYSEVYRFGKIELKLSMLRSIFKSVYE